MEELLGAQLTEKSASTGVTALDLTSRSFGSVILVPVPKLLRTNKPLTSRANGETSSVGDRLNNAFNNAFDHSGGWECVRNG
jgi:hypothetical protein